MHLNKSTKILRKWWFCKGKIELLIERSVNWSKNLFIIALKVNSYKNILNYYSSNPVTIKDNYRRIITKASSQSSSQSLVFFHYINYLRFSLSPKSDPSVCFSQICLMKTINLTFWGKGKRQRKQKNTGNM